MKILTTELIAWYKGKPEASGQYLVKLSHGLDTLYWTGDQWQNISDYRDSSYDPTVPEKSVLAWSHGPKGP